MPVNDYGPIPFPYGPSREQAIEAVRRVLGSKTEEPTLPSNINILKYNKPQEPTLLNFNPAKNDIYGLKDDPNMLLAAQIAKERYPNVWNKMGAINIGVPINEQDSKGTAAYVGKSFFDQPIVNMGDYPSRSWAGPNDILSALDVLRHELSHVAGLRDYKEGDYKGSNDRLMNAYDVERASDILHKDIELPSERKKLVR